MPAAKVRLYIRPSLQDGKRPFLDPVYADNNYKTLKRGLGVLDGREQKFDRYKYYIRYLRNGKRVWEPVGKDPSIALTQRQKTENRLEGIALGNFKPDELKPKPGPPPAPELTPKEAPEQEPPSSHAERRLLSTAIKQYLDGKRDAGKKKKTLSAYTTALDYFRESCAKTYLDEIERVDMLSFSQFLRDAKEHSARTSWNKFSNVMSFLKEEGIRGLVKKEDWPKYQEDDPEIYEPEDLQAFFAACTAEERLWFEFFLQTGMREQEVIYCRPQNVNVKHGTVFVRRNDDYAWTAKAYRGREIPIPASLTAKLAARKLPANAKLLFPTSTGNPKLDFLDCCKAIAKRAGLDPDNWWLHRFRATFATMHLQAGVDFRTVQKWLGHVDSASTLRYLRPARGKEVQAKVNQTWAVIGGAA
jgi:integrase/recombinase XerD